MKKQKYILFFTLKLLVVSLAFWYIYREIFMNKNSEEIKGAFRYLFTYPNTLCFSSVFLMMFLNWGIEALKWKFLLGKIEKPGFIKAFKATISGVTASVFTPNRAGEFLGRIFFIDKADKVQGSLIAVLGSMSQLLVTLICGSIALLFFISAYQPANFMSDIIFAILIFLVMLLNISAVALFFSASAVSLFLNKFPFSERLKKYSSVLSFYSPRELSLVLLLSFARYLVFSLQFFILMKIFSVEILFPDACVFIPLVFLAVAAVPTITPADIGVREFFALQFIGITSANATGIVVSTFFLWVINLAIPAIAGGIFILGKKINLSKCLQ